MNVNEMIIKGDCLEVMKTFPDNHFSAIVTDPPYGLHFMGKDWDCFKFKPSDLTKKRPGDLKNNRVTDTNGAYQAAIYDESRNDEFQSFITQFGIEATRIVKPGGHILMCGAPRRYHRQACGLEDAGWEIRDCLCWLFGSGFPKSHNHFGPEGFGTALKPAYEPIIMAMKPLDGTFKQNYEKWGVGGLNIDGCRIGNHLNSQPSGLHRGKIADYSPKNPDNFEPPVVNAKGRWPANLLLDEEAAEQLGSPSRFFYCAKTSSRERNEGLDGLPDKVGGGMCSTVSGDTRTGHITIQKNNHPTVKPLSLMRYLITLVSPPTNALILDPFVGSGTTILAAKQLGIDAIGIEKCPEYADIALARLKAQAEKINEVAQLNFFED